MMRCETSRINTSYAQDPPVTISHLIRKTNLIQNQLNSLKIAHFRHVMMYVYLSIRTTLLFNFLEIEKAAKRRQLFLLSVKFAINSLEILVLKSEIQSGSC